MLLDDSGQRQGPINSDYGMHLVLLTQQKTGGMPRLEQVYGKVIQDLRRELISEQLEENIQQLINTYSLNVLALDPML